VFETDTVSTGSLASHSACIGGLPAPGDRDLRPESSARPRLLHAVAEVQKAGGVAAYIDAEHALDPVYAKKLGVDIDEMLISQPDTANRRSRSRHAGAFGRRRNL